MKRGPRARPRWSAQGGVLREVLETLVAAPPPPPREGRKLRPF